MSDWNNPFQHNLLNSKAQTFAATADIPGEMPVAIDLRKNKTKERDPYRLCGSKHAVWIGIQPPPTGGPNKIIPFENSIVVAFWANDTSGGGILDPGAIIGGIGTMVSNPKKYEKTVATGLDIIWDNAANCGQEGGAAQRYLDCKNKRNQAVVYTGIYIVTAPVRIVAAAPSNINKIANHYGIWDSNEPEDEDDVWYDPRDWFDAQQSFSGDATTLGEFVGLDYHNVGASAHKVSIKITCRQNGVTRVVHDTELAGTSEVYAGNKPSPALAYFVIDSPGDWKVRVKSMASGSCADPRLDVVETFTVHPPTDESAAESHSALADRKITAPLVGLAATVLAYGLYKWYHKDTDAALLEYYRQSKRTFK
jgi:hypothetical protein